MAPQPAAGADSRRLAACRQVTDTAVHGPFSSEHMQSWQDQGYFKDKPVWVRRVSAEQAEDFKSSEEIDMFSMY